MSVCVCAPANMWVPVCVGSCTYMCMHAEAMCLSLGFIVVFIWLRVSLASPGWLDPHYVGQAGLELTEHSLPLPPECQDHSHVPPCLGHLRLFVCLFLILPRPFFLSVSTTWEADPFYRWDHWGSFAEGCTVNEMKAWNSFQVHSVWGSQWTMTSETPIVTFLGNLQVSRWKPPTVGVFALQKWSNSANHMV